MMDEILKRKQPIFQRYGSLGFLEALRLISLRSARAVLLLEHSMISQVETLLNKSGVSLSRPRLSGSASWGQEQKMARHRYQSVRLNFQTRDATVQFRVLSLAKGFS
jgi:hypothetical protein